MGTTSGPDGLLVLDKPVGPTSHDCVARVRKLLGTRRVGHAGTLDPFATGVLACCVGRATRLVRWLSGCDKTYEGVMRFGFATETGDHTGDPLDDPLPVRVAPAALAEAAAGLTGTIAQVPPRYSAKKRGGRRLHALARAGIEVELEPVEVTVRDWQLGELGADDLLSFRVTCSAGTYVRVLAEDLGRAVGCPAHLASLRRTAAGPVDLAGAVPLDGLDATGAAAALVPLDRMPLPLPQVSLLEAEGRRAFLHGQRLGPETFTAPSSDPPAEVAVRDAGGELLGVARLLDEGQLAPHVVIALS